jgi:hypothetical protein
MNKEPKYVLYVQDMFHCFDKPVRSEEYDNSIDAINSAKRKIRNSFEGRLDAKRSDRSKVKNFISYLSLSLIGVQICLKNKRMG